jgi:hypothetical protein
LSYTCKAVTLLLGIAAVGVVIVPTAPPGGGVVATGGDVITPGGGVITPGGGVVATGGDVITPGGTAPGGTAAPPGGTAAPPGGGVVATGGAIPTPVGMLPMVWLLAGENEMLQTLLYGDARVVPFPNSSTIVELSYTCKAVTLLLGIAAVGVVIVPTAPPGGGNATPGGGGGGNAPPGGGIVPVLTCACTKLPPLLSIPNIRTSVESIATLYRILLLII